MRGKFIFAAIVLFFTLVMFAACSQKQETASTSLTQDQSNPVTLNNQKVQPAKIAAEQPERIFIQEIQEVFGKEGENLWEKELFTRRPIGIIPSVQQDYEKVYAMARLLTSPFGRNNSVLWNGAGISEASAYRIFIEMERRLCQNMFQIHDLPMDVRKKAGSVGVGETIWNPARADEYLETLVQTMKLVGVGPEDLGVTTEELREIARLELRKEIRYFESLVNVPIENVVKYGTERWSFTRKELGV